MKLPISISKALELRIIQLYVWALVAPKYVDGRRTASIARHGAFEVRLIEVPASLEQDTVSLWIELFDHKSQTSIDSYGGYDFEEAASAAERLISLAKSLLREAARVAPHSVRFQEE